jgi:hypothetical protein
MKRFIVGAVFLAVAAGVALSSAQAAPKEIKYNGKTYYIVNSVDQTENTGDEVCAKLGKSCIGYTALTLDVCKLAHPNAASKTDTNGSKAGFYCDGAPQGGVCGKEKNTCHICPNCNLNMDCGTEIGGLYRETYVECGGGAVTPSKPGFFARAWSVPANWWGSFRSSLARSWQAGRQKVSSLFQITKIKKATIQVQGPGGAVTSADIPTDSIVCEFYQTKKKLVTCGAVKAADAFCATVMQSRFARAALCQENGVVICTNPCKPPESQVRPKQCAFDAERPRGSQAPPLEFCNETVTVPAGNAVPAQGKKKAGEVCNHGGECTTTYCLGQPSDSGIKYFCSCSPSKLDFTCGK